jgi:UDP-glucose 4-epimerase
MKVVVTGGAGFLGHHVVRALRARGDEVVVADLVPFAFDVPGIIEQRGDLREQAAIDACLDHGPDAVIHLAAITSVLKSVADPIGVYASNTEMTQRLLEGCRVRGINRFVFASTNAVVGDVGFDTITAAMPLRPLTPYGATKAACEMLMAGYAGSYGIITSANRFTNIYGAEMQLKDSIIARMMKAALAGEGIEIYGDGTQVRDYIYIEDAVNSLLLGLTLDEPATFIAGGGRSVSVNTLHQMTVAATNCPIPSTHIAPKPGEMPAVIVDISASAACGFTPTWTLERGLDATWESFTA